MNGRSRSLAGVRIAMVLSNDAVSDPRVEKEARALNADGAEVVVVAWDRSRTLPAEEDRGAFRVIRRGPAARHGAGLKNLGAYRVFWRDAAREVIALKPDVVHCHDVDTALVAARVQRELGAADCAVVLDLHELYRESRMIPRGGLKGAIAKLGVWWIERAAAQRSSLIVIVTPGQAGLVAGVPAEDPRIVIVENAPDLARFAASGRVRSAEDPLTVCFVGQKRAAGHVVDLMDAVDRVPGTRALVAGGGPAEAAVAEAGRDRERVEVFGRVNYEDIPALYARCDAVYAVYETDYGNYRTALPVKAMEGMAIGVPVLVSRGTWMQDYVERHGIGEAVEERDVAAIAAVLERWRDDPESCREMGARGRGVIERELNWEASAARLVEGYRRMMADRGKEAAR